MRPIHHPEIVFLDKSGTEVGRVKRQSLLRLSMQAASDHQKMDNYAATHPNVMVARIGDHHFSFRNGRSMSDMKL